MKDSLDDSVEEILRDETASSLAVKSLIEVGKRKAGEDSEVELKTDLTEDEIKIHTVLAVLSNVLEMDEKSFSKNCILSSVIEKKERKALSKDRKSRAEIVTVARQPEMLSMGMPMENPGMLRRFFSPRKNNMGGQGL